MVQRSSHGQSGQNLVKIIRYEPIETANWDANSDNDFSKATISTLLNEYYLYQKNAINSDYCYGYRNGSNLKCDYSFSGIRSSYRDLIQEVTWYLGGDDGYSTNTASDFYSIERGSTVYSGNNTTYIGYIGLMYPSDYGYAVPSSYCSRSVTLYNYQYYRYDNCTLYNWIFQYKEWTITAASDDGGDVFFVSDDGSIHEATSSHSGGYAIRPVLYLKSGTYIIDGNGTVNDPYIIGM